MIYLRSREQWLWYGDTYKLRQQCIQGSSPYGPNIRLWYNTYKLRQQCIQGPSPYGPNIRLWYNTYKLRQQCIQDSSLYGPNIRLWYNEENFKHFVFKTKNGNAIVYGMNQHYVMKLQFRTNEGPLVYWVQVFYIKW
jgi:hypothetical protein